MNRLNAALRKHEKDFKTGTCSVLTEETIDHRDDFDLYDEQSQMEIYISIL